MAKINYNYRKLKQDYLFGEIAKRTTAFSNANPDNEIIKLGIGDTTLPLTETVVAGLKDAVEAMGTDEGYRGYGVQKGQGELRKAVAQYYKKTTGVSIDPDEVFISDGAKSDTANIQGIFAADSVIAVQDPVYPVYVDTAVLSGKTGENNDGNYDGIIYMPCGPEHGFFPEVPSIHVDIIYLCSPNNPTGTVASFEQLQSFVEYALKNNAIIIFDSAYSFFIQDDSVPRSIYEIERADECTIEISSFSKWAGFTGVRLGWTIVPKKLQTEDSKPGELNAMWERRQSTMFNGASNIIQAGGLAVLSDKGVEESNALAQYYMKNTHVIRAGLENIGIETYGGEHAPYIWLKVPEGFDSWSFFDELLNKASVVGTPGEGFGSQGKGYFRLSGFNHLEKVQEAMKRIQANFDFRK